MVDPSRTFYASQAVELAELLSLKFANEQYGTNVKRMLKVLEPEGPSTDGGRKARQPLMLVKMYEEDDKGLMCGWIDSAKRTAELRSYLVLSQQFQARYKTELDLSRGEYDRFLQSAQDFLKVQGIEIHFSNTPRQRAASIPPGAVTGKKTVVRGPKKEFNLIPLLIVLAFVAGFVLCLALVRFEVLVLR